MTSGTVPNTGAATRQATDGPRYAVRYRLGGRAYPIVHGGSFRTLREAKVRRDFIAGEIAAGRNPADALAALVAAPAAILTLDRWAERYLASRVDLAAPTLRAMHSHVDALGSLAERDPQAITAADVQEWLAGLKMKPASVARYLKTLRGLFDFIGLDPNVARDARVRLPREPFPSRSWRRSPPHVRARTARACDGCFPDARRGR
jgi:hypothetical protein